MPLRMASTASRIRGNDDLAWIAETNQQCMRQLHSRSFWKSLQIQEATQAENIHSKQNHDTQTRPSVRIATSVHRKRTCQCYIIAAGCTCSRAPSSRRPVLALRSPLPCSDGRPCITIKREHCAQYRYVSLRDICARASNSANNTCGEAYVQSLAPCRNVRECTTCVAKSTIREYTDHDNKLRTKPWPPRSRRPWAWA